MQECMIPTILAVAEPSGEHLPPVSFEAFAAAAMLAASTGGRAEALILGAQAPPRTVPGLTKTVVVDSGTLSEYSPDVYAAVLAHLAQSRKADVILMAATATGKDLMARAAEFLGVSLAQDCTGISVEDRGIVFARPLYGGKMIADVQVRTRPILATLRPRCILPGTERVPADIEVVQVDGPDPRVTVEAADAGLTGRPDVTEARIVVSGGRGMQGPQHWSILEALVAALGPDATLACSLPVSDLGWRPGSEHVGQTGRTIAPDLYIACGISGAIQHVAGISGSKCIVAINKDPEAPIFKIADYAIVGDLFEVVPALTAAISELRQPDFH